MLTKFIQLIPTDIESFVIALYEILINIESESNTVDNKQPLDPCQGKTPSLHMRQKHGMYN